jgi:hypothetical protein
VEAQLVVELRLDRPPAEEGASRTPFASTPELPGKRLLGLVSIVAGIVTMMGLIGPLNPRPLNPQSFLFGCSIRLPQTVQLISFAAATAFLVVYGVGAWTIGHHRRK